jgi:hypothetical protein
MFGLLLILFLGGWSFFQFWKRRYVGNKRHWADMVAAEKLYLSLGIGTSIQLLFVTMIPGWLVAATLIGKGAFADSRLGSEVWGVVMVATNTIIYGGLTHLMLTKIHREPEVESLHLE